MKLSLLLLVHIKYFNTTLYTFIYNKYNVVRLKKKRTKKNKDSYEEENDFYT